jgi:cell division protein FtsI (penicillin-binding protein 3)
MLETVVGPEGTGRRAGLRGLRVAGKTGTAQKLDADGRYSLKRYQAWFVGAVPAERPRLVIAALVDEPRGYIHTGGATAAPLFAKVAAAALARDGILTEPELPLPEWAYADWVPPWKTSQQAAPKRAAAAAKPALARAARREAARTRLAPPARARPAASQSRPPASELATLGDRVLLPDLRGKTPEQVRALLARNGITLQASGSGRAIAQDPAPGTIVRGGSIRVRFGVGGSGR